MQNLKTDKNSQWSTVKLFELVDAKKGKKPSSLTEESLKDYIPYIDIEAFEKGIINRYTNDKSTIISDQDRDILVVWDGARAGLVGKASGAVGSTLMRLTPKSINRDFLLLFLLSKYEEINKNPRGTGIPHVNPDLFWQMEIKLPSLQEQESVAERINHILPLIAQNKARIVKTRNLIKKFRQAILTTAITGKLTEDWRENNKNLVDASQIVKKIEDKRLSEVKTVANKNKISEIYEHQETNNDNVLPVGWKYVSLDKLCESFQYGTSAKSQPEGSVPVLRMGNLQNGEIDWTDLVFTSNEKEIEKYKLKKGDVLFNRTNSPELVGKTSIYRGEREAIFAGYLIKVDNFHELNSEYLNYCLNSHYARAYCNNVKTDGVSQSNINAQKLGKFEIPFCSGEEQHEIVRLIKMYFDAANKVETQIEDAEIKVSKLTQTILRKVFS